MSEIYEKKISIEFKFSQAGASITCCLNYYLNLSTSSCCLVHTDANSKSNACPNRAPKE